jgi:hypothetical protein
MGEKKEVLYCGDATLETGACYLGAVMTLAKIGFDYVPMDDPFPEQMLENKYRLIRRWLGKCRKGLPCS